MPFEFANPALLWGTLAAAVPLLVHLFNRKRARTHEFAAIDFVLRSRRRTASRLRLKRLLLFLARTLLLVAIPVALARPQARKADVAAAPQGPAATALVLDTSLSMAYELSGRTLLDRARQRAREALAELAPEDPVTFVSCEKDAPAPAAPGFDRGRVRDAIASAAQTYEPQDLTACVARAARALGESPLPAKRIILATDLTAAAFRLDVPAPVVATPAGEVRPEVVLLDAAGGEKTLPNRALSNLRVEPATAVGNRAFQFTLTVENHGPEPVKDLTALLKVGSETVAKGFVDVPARGTAVKTLTYRFPAGGSYSGSVEIAHDALPEDDVRYFAMKVPRDVKALVVNGAPHAVRFLDEVFFVEAALNASGSPVRPTFRDPETVNEERFADYDVVLLLNVRELSPLKARELTEFVQRGGGLFLSLGDQIDPDLYNERFGELLPRPLHLVKTAARREEAEADRRAARLGQVLFDHPALHVFAGDAREGIVSARTYKYFLLSPGAPGEVTVIASFDDGAPALLEARRGRGRVILFTSTVDRDWSDWAIRSSFLPSMQRMAGWLAGALEERALAQVLVGEARVIEPPPGATGLRVKTPSGDEEVPKSDGQGRLVFADTARPGVHTVSGRVNGTQGPLGDLAFAVNVDPRESDLARLEERELKAYFGEKTRTERQSGSSEAASELPPWSLLLAAGAVLFLAEGALARR